MRSWIASRSLARNSLPKYAQWTCSGILQNILVLCLDTIFCLNIFLTTVRSHCLSCLNRSRSNRWLLPVRPLGEARAAVKSREYPLRFVPPPWFQYVSVGCSGSGIYLVSTSISYHFIFYCIDHYLWMSSDCHVGPRYAYRHRSERIPWGRAANGGIGSETSGTWPWGSSATIGPSKAMEKMEKARHVGRWSWRISFHDL